MRVSYGQGFPWPLYIPHARIGVRDGTYMVIPVQEDHEGISRVLVQSLAGIQASTGGRWRVSDGCQQTHWGPRKLAGDLRRDRGAAVWLGKTAYHRNSSLADLPEPWPGPLTGSTDRRWIASRNVPVELLQHSYQHISYIHASVAYGRLIVIVSLDLDSGLEGFVL